LSSRVEHALTRRMVEVFTLDTHAPILDMTNFATFIDSANERVPVAQRGKAKQKTPRPTPGRPGLAAAGDGGISLLSRVYAGNHTDVTQLTP
jgi:hypothetical protein